MSHDWGYGKNDGPSTWAHNYPIANGPRQSPIDIVPSKATYDASLKPLQLKYDPSTCLGIQNNGHSIQVTFADDTNSSTLTGGPISETYRLKQFHFHWGGNDHKGCEHTVDGQRFPAELHLVHWNTKYASFNDAVDKPDGLAVVGVFLKIGEANPHLNEIIEVFSAIKTKNKQATFANFNPTTLLPHSLDYWTYEGSLTTPPLYESVTWIVLKEPIHVCHTQMAKFRTLCFSAEGQHVHHMENNYRPPQPLKGRHVRASFK